MSMTLADFEKLCLYGPLGSLHQTDEMAALNRVQELANRYRERLEAHSSEWRPVKHTRRAPRQALQRKGGIEHSLPAGDRA